MTMSNTLQRAAFLRELEENLWETWSTFGRGPGCCLHETSDMLWFETPIPIVPYNGVLKCQMESGVDQAIDDLVDRFRERSAHFMWIHHPSARPHDLPERLLAHGLRDVEPILGMARTLDDLLEVTTVPPGVDIRQVRTERDASAFTQFAAWRWHIPDEYQVQYASIAQGFRFGMPGSRAHMWQAWYQGQPVAKAGMYLSSDSAGIYAVVTRPQARRQGLARALTLTALHAARSRGYRVAVLHSTPVAERLYQSLGFDTIAEFRLYASEEVYV
jgi:ribosomal protein S18 acetylase RimI-like enzyme